jgi:uncharacterized protein (TIGR00251 family)
MTMGVHGAAERQGGEVILSVKVHPNARGDAVRAWDPATRVLDLAIGAPPVDGKANDAVVRYLAGLLGVPRREVRIRSGEGSRHKRVEVPDDAPLVRLEPTVTR